MKPYKEICAEKKKDDRCEWGKRKEGRLVKAFPLGCKSTMHTDSGMFSL